MSGAAALAAAYPHSTASSPCASLSLTTASFHSITSCSKSCSTANTSSRAWCTLNGAPAVKFCCCSQAFRCSLANSSRRFVSPIWTSALRRPTPPAAFRAWWRDRGRPAARPFARSGKVLRAARRSARQPRQSRSLPRHCQPARELDDGLCGRRAFLADGAGREPRRRQVGTIRKRHAHGLGRLRPGDGHGQPSLGPKARVVGNCHAQQILELVVEPLNRRAQLRLAMPHFDPPALDLTLRDRRQQPLLVQTADVCQH